MLVDFRRSPGVFESLIFAFERKSGLWESWFHSKIIQKPFDFHKTLKNPLSTASCDKKLAKIQI